MERSLGVGCSDCNHLSMSATSLPARKPTPLLSPHSGESVRRGERRCEVSGRLLVIVLVLV